MSHLSMALRGDWRRTAASALTATAGALTIAAQVPSASRAVGDRLVLPFAAPFGHAVALAGGVAVLALARGMWAGNRRAADVALAIVLVLGLARWAEGQGLSDVGLDLGAAALLALSRDAFPRTRPGRGWRTPGAVAVLAGAIAYALHTSLQLHQQGSTDVDRAVDAGRRLVAHASWLSPNGSGRVLLDLLLALAVLATALSLRALLRPEPAAEGHTASAHDRAAGLVERFGDDSLDPFALRADKSFHFAAGGFLAYRTLRETAVVAGDPVAPPGRAPAVLASFLETAEARGWDVVVTGASGRHLEPARALGLRAVPIGEEAIVDPARFTLDGRAMRKVRQSVARVERRGWTVQVIAGNAVTPPLLAELEVIEQDWRARQTRLQGFAMTLGRLWGAAEDVRSLYVLARDPEGRLKAFLRFAEFGAGLSLDVMRRAAGGQPNGVNEALVVAALERARETGLREVSLNFAGFAHVMAADAALDRGQRVLRWALRRARGRFQLERLVAFNSKFAPAWRPRYLLYRRRSRLPLAGLRVLQAEAYVRPPRGVRPLSVRWEPRTGEA